MKIKKISSYFLPSLIILTVYVISLFAPAVHDSDGYTFQIITENYFKIISKNFPLFSLLALLALFVVISLLLKTKKALFLSLGLLFGYIFGIIGITNFNYLSITYVYGYWLTNVLGLAFCIMLFVATRIVKDV